MPAYHITGPNGSGKSTVGRVLQNRGFRVIETDFEPGVSAWFNNESGQKAKRPDILPIPANWLAAHSWLWNRQKIDGSMAHQACFEHLNGMSDSLKYLKQMEQF